MLRFSLVILLVLASSPTRAEDDRTAIRQMLVSSCKAWRNCGQYFRPRQFHERHYELHTWRRPDQDERREWRAWRTEDWEAFERRRWTREDRERDGFKCVGVDVEVLSAQHTTKEEARIGAGQLWAARVQWVYGGQWMEIGESARFRTRCGVTQPGDGAAQGWAELGNNIAKRIPGTPQFRSNQDNKEVGAFRCELVAMPCRDAREWREPPESQGSYRRRKKDRR